MAIRKAQLCICKSVLVLVKVLEAHPTTGARFTNSGCPVVGCASNTNTNTNTANTNTANTIAGFTMLLQGPEENIACCLRVICYFIATYAEGGVRSCYPCRHGDIADVPGATVIFGPYIRGVWQLCLCGHVAIHTRILSNCTLPPPNTVVAPAMEIIARQEEELVLFVSSSGYIRHSKINAF